MGKISSMTSMNCRKIKKYFSAYFEGDLSSPKSEAFRVHLQTCEACRREWNDFQRTVEFIRSMPKLEPSAYFDVRLQAKLMEGGEQRAEGRVLNLLNFAFRLSPFAFIMLLLLVGWQLYQRLPSEPSYIPNQKSQNVAQKMNLSPKLSSSTQFILPDVSISRDNSSRWRDFRPKESDSDENELNLSQNLNLNLVLPSVSSDVAEPGTDYILKKVSFLEGEEGEL
jgi:hypothetical protein